MSITNLNNKIKSFTAIDIGLIKISVLFGTLTLVKFFPKMINFDWYFYLILAILFAIIPLKTMFFHEKNEITEIFEEGLKNAESDTSKDNPEKPETEKDIKEAIKPEK